MLALVGYEIKRNLRPAQALPLLGLCMLLVLGHDRILSPRSWARLQGALALNGDWLWLANPLLAGVVGSSLSDERRKGIARTFLARGVPRGRYLLSKMLGSAASAAILMAAAIVGFYAIAVFLWPWGPVEVKGDETGPGPVPALYALSPVANDLALIVMAMVAVGATSAVAVLAGTLTTNRYVAMAAPLLVLIVGIVLDETHTCRTLSPIVYVSLTNYYPTRVPVPLHPYAAFLYWLCFVIVAGALSRWIFARRELA